jgi:DNA-binding response OmpR family regulator
MSETGADCILIVEPDILARQPLAEYLRDCGFKVVEAMNADEARALLAEGHLQIDCVLADASAEPEAAFGLARWIRESLASVEVVLAGSIVKTVNEAGKLCNEGPALVKPYQHEYVLEHIKRLLAARVFR